MRISLPRLNALLPQDADNLSPFFSITPLVDDSEDDHGPLASKAAVSSFQILSSPNFDWQLRGRGAKKKASITDVRQG